MGKLNEKLAKLTFNGSENFKNLNENEQNNLGDMYSTLANKSNLIIEYTQAYDQITQASLLYEDKESFDDENFEDSTQSRNINTLFSSLIMERKKKDFFNPPSPPPS